MEIVRFRFLVPDLQDLFEDFNTEQSHAALEGALNILYGKPPIDLGEVLGVSDNDIFEDDLTHEANLTSEYVSRICESIVSGNEDILTIWQVMMPLTEEGEQQEVDYTVLPIYDEMERKFKDICDRLGFILSTTEGSVDLMVLSDEMEMKSEIILRNYGYDSVNDLLTLELSFQ